MALKAPNEPNLSETEAEEGTDSNDAETNPDEIKYPKVAKYYASTVRGLQKGETKMWCACGLSKNQPWCDGSHKGTGITPLKWTVPTQQTLYQICLCKYSSKKPYCDGSHINLPLTVLDRQDSCQSKGKHTDTCKLCTGCGWAPDF